MLPMTFYIKYKIIKGVFRVYDVVYWRKEIEEKIFKCVIF